MTVLTDAIRPFWLPGLNSVSGSVDKGLSGWICDREFQIYDDPLDESFTLEVSEPTKLLRSFAADISRPALAAFETINQISRSDLLPKSAAWLVIKSYYASYFAAHAIIRMLGTSFLHITKQELNAVNKVAGIFGKQSSLTTSGYFVCRFASRDNKLICTRNEKGAGANHETFWVFFVDQIKTLRDEILNAQLGSASTNKLAAIKLTELHESLCRTPAWKGNWLSYIRNEVNYKQRLGVWYPYREVRSFYETLFERCGSWEDDAETIDLVRDEGHSLKDFQRTCAFMVSLCRELVQDMAYRCPSGKSFHVSGALGFINLLKQKRTSRRLTAKGHAVAV
jgi:hypothetical protein